MYRTIASLAIVLLATRGVVGAEIALRDRAVLNGSVVRLGDVADIAAVHADELDRLAATPLMPAPAPGAVHYLQATELLHLLAARGVDVGALKFSGAETIAIGGNDAALATEVIEGGGGTTPAVSRRDTVVSLTSAVVTDYLREQTGHELWNVEVLVDDRLTATFTDSQTRPIVSGGKAPWTGLQRFEVSFGTQAKGVTVSVRVQRIEMAAVAMRAIEKGDLIRSTDIEMRPVEGALSRNAVASLEQVIGKEAVQSIRPNAAILTTQVRAPLIVRRGERVRVRARAAGVAVRTYATAQQDGGLGDLVMVESLEGKERYAARVSGLRELEIFAAGAVAADVASLDRR